jgi:hypothetical protein
VRRRKTDPPVTVGQLPLVRCAVCQQTVAHRPGKYSPSEVLTKHYERSHPELLGRKLHLRSVVYA